MTNREEIIPEIAREKPRHARLRHPELSTNLFLILIIVALSLSGCSSVPERADSVTWPKRTDAWPLYYHEQTERTESTDILWPVGGIYDTPETLLWGVWPLLTVYNSKQFDVTQVQGLYPIVSHYGDASRQRTWVLPIFVRDQTQVENSEPITNYTLFPLFFWGTSPPELRHFAFFPVYGTIRGRFARDKIFFVLFPAYSTSRVHGRVAHNVLFPLIAWTHSPTSRSHRVLPFYTFYHRDGEPQLWSFLWPIVHFSKSKGDETRPRNMFIIFPLFGWDHNPRRHNWSVLWPIFTYQRTVGTDYYDWIGPWPFVRIQDGKDIYRRQFWPFYGYLQDNEAVTQYILWPGYRQYYKDTKYLTKREQSVLVILWQNKSLVNKFNHTRQTRKMVWPLFRYSEDFDGATRIEALSLLWFTDPERFERQYGRFWRIFEYVNVPARDETSYRFLWRLIRYDRRENYKTFNFIGPVIRYEHETETKTAFSILGGLLTVGSERGAPVFKLLYIPFAGGKN